MAWNWEGKNSKAYVTSIKRLKNVGVIGYNGE
jgi:hypothetical protein